MVATTNLVFVHLLNPTSEPITLYEGTEVTTLEKLEILGGTVRAVGNVNVPETGDQVQNMLWELAEKAGPGLISSKKETFFALLCLLRVYFKVYC